MVRSLTAVLALTIAGPALASAQAPSCWVNQAQMALEGRASPLDSATVVLGGQTMKVCYGSPAAHGRTVMGGLVPYDQPWRSGANEATSIHLPFAAEVAGIRLEPGSYSLYTIPGAEHWTVVVNRQVERWGTPISGAVRQADVGTGMAMPEALGQSVESLRYRFEPAGNGQADLLLEWERTRIRIPVRRAGR